MVDALVIVMAMVIQHRFVDRLQLVKPEDLVCQCLTSRGQATVERRKEIHLIN